MRRRAPVARTGPEDGRGIGGRGGGGAARGRGASRGRGFTLVEVVVALLVLEIGVLGVLGTVVVAADTLRRAERLARASARVEATLDSLRRGASPDSASVALEDVRIEWVVDDRGRVEVTATDEHGGALVRARSRVPVR